MLGRILLVFAATVVLMVAVAYFGVQSQRSSGTGNADGNERFTGNVPTGLDQREALYGPYLSDTAGSTPNGRSPCDPKARLTAQDLLPKDAANLKWAQVNPAGQGDLKDKNFLTAGYHVGINTVGQTLRNPNYQLRSEPPNPQAKVGPWLQSTIDPDTNRRHFEVGDDC